MRVIDNKLYIEPKEATGINYETMKSNISRGKYIAISNPSYNGKNAKKLVLVDSLPEVHKKAILERFQGNIKSLEQGIENGLKQNPSLEVSEIITEATANVVKIGERFINDEFTDYINKNYAQHMEHFRHLSTEYKHIERYARTSALIIKIWDIYTASAQNATDQKAFKRIRRAFVLNITQLLSDNKNINVLVPKSDFRLTEWMDKVLNAIDTNTSVYELVGVKNCGNDNNQRLTPEQGKIAMALYNKGNRPTIISVYDTMVAMGKERGWWIKNGEYKPISSGTLNNFLKDFKNIATLGREGNLKYINNAVPSISRRYPAFINEIWSTDGSPLDELIYENGKSRQNMNTYRVYDVGSSRWLSVSIWKGKGEPVDKIIEALNKAVKTTGVFPKALQCDRGSGFSEIKKWCEDNGVIFIPANTGLARAKIAESLIGRFRVILKERGAYAGGNRTAKTLQLSPEQYRDAQKNAFTFEQTSHWLETEGMDAWNNMIIETLEKKPCGKTPNQLYSEKPCKGIVLDAMKKTILTGKSHRIKLTIEGLEVRNNKISYVYFPDVTTEKGRENGKIVYMKTPLHNHPQTGKLTLYFDDYNAEWAYIFDKNVEKGGKLIDVWRLKTSVDYVASLNNDTEMLGHYQKFQKGIKQLAKEQLAIDEATFISENLNISADALEVREMMQEHRILELENSMAKEVQNRDMDEWLSLDSMDDNVQELVHPVTGEVIKMQN